MMVMGEGEKNRTVACTKMNTNRWTIWTCMLDYLKTIVSVPDPNQPQCGSLPVPRVILEAIRAGAGLGLGPRLPQDLMVLHISLTS